MTGAGARGFHDATKHTWRSVRQGGRRLDWENRPAPFKLYPDLEPRRLPLEVAESGRPAAEVLSGLPPAQPRQPDLGWLAGLLFFSAGVTRRWRRGRRSFAFRAAPSAGALYPVEVYVACGDLPGGVRAGLHHFEPEEFALRRLRSGDPREQVARAVAAPEVAGAPLTLIATGIPFRTTWKYGLRGYRHLFWDAGTILAHVLAVAEAAGVGARVLAGFVDAELEALLGLAGDDELPLAVVPLGASDGTGEVAAAPPSRLDVRAPPVAPRPHVDQRLLRAHRAGNIDHPGEVAGWRQRMADLAVHPATGRLTPPAAATGTLEDVVLRRGSTRRFARTKIRRSALTWPLRVASRAVPGDLCATGALLLVHELVVHAVEGLRPGAYRWGRRDGPELLRSGGFREETATLCLEQALGGDGAYTVFHNTDLDRVLAAGGSRAYRAVQLAGGVAAGRLQLAAHALGVGATGLTFYDGDVSAFFGTGLEPVTVTAVGIPDYQPRPGRRPAEDPPPVLRG